MKPSVILPLVAFAILTIIVVNYNPFGLIGIANVWYFLPVIFTAGLIFVRPAFSSRQADVPDEDVRVQAVKSILRHVLTALTAIIAFKAGLNINIPYIDSIFELVKYLLGQTDTVVNAVMTLISFATVVFGFFKQGLRFEQTAKGLTKGRKYPGI